MHKKAAIAKCSCGFSLGAKTTFSEFPNIEILRWSNLQLHLKICLTEFENNLTYFCDKCELCKNRIEFCKDFLHFIFDIYSETKLLCRETKKNPSEKLEDIS